ncbi:hypothetical protein L7F22_038662 [Adiantum nelumboides]|nr:hypothetical protein [Adiantum nelumboides]
MSRPRSRTRRAFPGPAAPDLCWKAARGRSYALGLQHPEGVFSSPRPSSPRRSQKRRRRNYTTPKKIKHKRKKVKMGVLRYYKVDGDGKIKRLRRECPSPECGAGVFLSLHANRQYCGKCHLTYLFEPGSKPPAV